MYMWNLNKLIESGKRLVFAKARVWGLSEVVKRYKFPVTRQIISGYVIYSIVPIVNNTVLHICKLLRD